ncbi:MAG: valine--tRNA ligase [Spirochaetales bacterium]|uniref:Valine--tRNA ligase n=1 Tax=Candidatus Thalassospirochaeta sargassi TaxID=3119039 RepID=A0AAJ1MN79_9SPIO|nr:valine--tRNA ligase [Spirochaetales bacterium]
MSTSEMAKAYNPKDFEDRIYKYWTENGCFQPADTSDEDKDPFVIVIPPPNVTGVLHMGHGLNNILQDVLIRYHRMNGRPALWVPGTDHAGIATQNIVEKRLRAKGIERHELGREKFVEETWKVKDEHHAIIKKQLQKIGSSCDWSRERFTLDEGCSKAVREVFVGLYERGLVYKGNYLVNWCPSCGTALADDEVEHEEQQGKMYHYYYPLEDGSGKLEIATTRPETMLGDSAVAVHPDDERYKHLIGKMLKLPLTDRLIPIVADSYVSIEFGTGAVKVTPAHDPNDWEIGNRHDLERINILNDDATLNSNVPEKYRGLDVIEARKAVVEDLKAEGLYIKDVEHVHQVGQCYRCNTTVQPYLSKQWFVSMKGMAEKALKAWENDEIEFFPRKWENTYKHWLNNIRDWCISRQLWWGHRIPVWYCDDCGEMIVANDDPSECPKCGSMKLTQDSDVLDTWFSSWLWPFSTLGWPEKTDDLKKFFPTSTLVTGYDIIFFWVSRMIMASLEFMEEVPFRDIYITGLVRDKQGRKMSKSLGNGLDPLEIVDEFGADALKFTMTFLSAQGQDILIDTESFKLGSKFANKVWNASRYIMMNVEGRNIIPFENIELKEIDKWILHRLNEGLKNANAALEVYRFNDFAQAGYEFFWNDFCDWYIEASKLSLYSKDEAEKDRAISMLVYVLEQGLKMLHPYLSFITEEIYQKLPQTEGPLITAEYPAVTEAHTFPDTAESFALLQDLIRGIRTLRSEFTIPPEKKIPVTVFMDDGFRAVDFFSGHKALIAQLVNTDKLELTTVKPSIEGSVAAAGSGFEAYVYIRDVIDIDKEVAKLKKEQQKMEKMIKQTEGKLKNERFLSNAPEDVVEKEKSKLAEFTERAQKVGFYISELTE